MDKTPEDMLKDIKDVLPTNISEQITDEELEKITEEALDKEAKSGFMTFGQLMMLIQVLQPTFEKMTEKSNQFEQIRFYLIFGFAVSITITIFVFSGWLIDKGETDTGIAILTHVVALLAGAIGGSAIFKKSE